MHSRDRELYLKDIADSCSKILRYAESLNRADFFQDEKTYDAVLRNLEIIGEAAKNVDDEFRQDNPDIDWRQDCGVAICNKPCLFRHRRGCYLVCGKPEDTEIETANR